MSDLFGGTSVPKWMSPTDLDQIYSAKGREDAAPFIQSFQSALSRSSQQQFQREQVSDQRAYQEQQQQQAMTALRPVAEALKGVNSAEGMMKVVSDHPEWMMNPTTGPFIQASTKNWMTAEKIKSDAQKAESGTIAGKMALNIGGDFVKQLHALDDPEAQSSIANMSPGKNGLPSNEQWQALGLAKAAAEQRKKNAATQAEIEARQRGDVSTTTISDKGGVVTKLAPPKDNVRSGASTFTYLQKLRDDAYSKGDKKTGDELEGRIGKLSGSDSGKDKSIMASIIESRIKSLDRELLKDENSIAKAKKSKDVLERVKTLNYQRLEAAQQLNDLHLGTSSSQSDTSQSANSNASAKPLTSDIAADYLSKAKGDRATAEKMARDDGYTW